MALDYLVVRKLLRLAMKDFQEVDRDFAPGLPLCVRLNRAPWLEL